MYSVVNHVVTRAPAPGHRLRIARLDGARSLDLVALDAAAQRLALQLSRLGLRAGDRLGILAANCLEWVLLDLAALRLKVVTAGFEPGKFTPDAGLLARYGVSMLFTDRASDVPGVRPISEVSALVEAAGAADDQAGGEPGRLPPVSYAPDDVTTIKFTSGSTGEPKGLAATVGSIDSSLNAIQEMFAHGSDDELFAFLPLSLLQQRYWVYSALCFGHDLTVSTYEAAFPALATARPTVVMGVPAFYETAKTHIEARARRAEPGDPDALRRTARRFFGDRIRYLWTGSAPARPDMLRFFDAVGMPMYEGYGLNETCIVSKNCPGAHRPGSVGRVLAGKKVRFDDDGVISIFSDYPVNSRYEYAAPGESQRVFGDGGVVHTGDLGYLDDDGYLYIRGRADDVIVLDNGKKVIVRPIEERMKASPAIDECVVFCPTQTHLVAVVSPADTPADEAGITAWLARCNDASSQDEQIRNVVVARPRFSVDNAMLTSQFKPRRGRILAAYQAEVEAALAAAPGTMTAPCLALGTRPED